MAASFVDATDSRYGFSSKDIRKLGGSELSRINDLIVTDHGKLIKVIYYIPICGMLICECENIETHTYTWCLVLGTCIDNISCPIFLTLFLSICHTYIYIYII